MSTSMSNKIQLDESLVRELIETKKNELRGLEEFNKNSNQIFKVLEQSIRTKVLLERYKTIAIMSLIPVFIIGGYIMISLAVELLK